MLGLRSAQPEPCRTVAPQHLAQVRRNPVLGHPRSGAEQISSYRRPDVDVDHRRRHRHQIDLENLLFRKLPEREHFPNGKPNPRHVKQLDAQCWSVRSLDCSLRCAMVGGVPKNGDLEVDPTSIDVDGPTSMIDRRRRRSYEEVWCRVPRSGLIG